MKRDFNHPAIIGWCPFNETWDCGTPVSRQQDDLLRMVYRLTKEIDPTRPCIDTSGVSHVETDLYDVHDYDQNPETFAARYDALRTSGTFEDPHYADRQRYEGLTNALMKNPEICGMCYTQLYDVEQEQNGLYTYERQPKIDIARIREINTKKAAIEE